MNTKKKLEAEAIAKYRAGAARRRGQRILEKVISATAPTASAAGINYTAGVVTIKKPANAKPVSSLGGATKVFGRSSFAIPELGHYAKRSTR